MTVPDIAIKVSNFKCFGEVPQGFDAFKLFNILIGRNNSGKSALLDIFPNLVSDKPEFELHLHRSGRPPELIACTPLRRQSLYERFRDAPPLRGVPYQIPQLIDELDGGRFTWRMHGPRDTDSLGLELRDKIVEARISGNKELLAHLRKGVTNPFHRWKFYRIAAERDIVPELCGEGDIQIKGNGRGVTDAIQRFINDSHLPSELVIDKMLSSLNEIFGPDATFKEIICQRDQSTKCWEIFLNEATKGRIRLSQSGSGLKTVILVLAQLILDVHGRSDLSNVIFAFEELENNIHPALLRRLLGYLLTFAREKDAMMLLTTHSNVAIDFVAKKEDAQLVHVMHDKGVSVCRTVSTYAHNSFILDDLDIRASDILQSNCIIWVEGPSDRVYINRWLEIFAEGRLREGLHYQCVFYGGRLLSHLTAAPPETLEEYICLLRANRRVCLVMDSDRQKRDSALNSTKLRLQKEVEDSGGLVWITGGREIENYVHADVVARTLSIENSKQVTRYQKFSNYLNAQKKKEGDRFDRNKHEYSVRFTREMSGEDCLGVLDLTARLQELSAQIISWNDIRA
ncbi:MAG: AAA family ATPase [Pirellulaceae bacterium]